MNILSVGAARSRRVRITWSTPLASSAFDSTLYAISPIDSSGGYVNVTDVYAVGGNAAVCELILDGDLISGAAYTLTIVGTVHALNGDTATGISQNFLFAVAPVHVNVESLVSDRDLILFKRDFVWNGVDFAEDGTGDLATIGGVVNAESAILRRLMGSPLPYDDTYSPNARQYVDGNDASPLTSTLRQQTLQDPRVNSVVVTIASSGAPNEIVFSVVPTLIGGRKLEPIPVTVNG